MRVLKFGGTSVGTAERMKAIKSIIVNGEQKVVVLSAMSGTTNALVEISDFIKQGEIAAAKLKTQGLHQHYLDVISDLFAKEPSKNRAQNYVNDIFLSLDKHIENGVTPNTYNEVVSNGELLSTFLFNLYLNESGIKSMILPAFEFMVLNENGEPNFEVITKKLNRLIQNNASEIYITQGFITLNCNNEVSNLQRGGSDYTATIIGAVLRAKEVQIWTDIDGFHNNDPRYVNNTQPIAKLSFDEAAELAYFGAKILHPQTVIPVRELHIPIRLKNTMNPDAEGTLIATETQANGVKAIAAKDGITAIKIKSERMLLAYGFLRKVFEVFENYKTPIDMITTSEVAVSLTIDTTINLDQIVKELQTFAKVEVDYNQTIICLAGHDIVNHQDTHKLFKVLNTIPVRMISYGGSNSNISLLINSPLKNEALNVLHNYVFTAEISKV